MSMKTLFLSEIKTELLKHPVEKPVIFTEADIAHLPAPVQNYIRTCGYLGKNKMTNVRVHWSEAYLKRGHGKDWMKLECYQFNSVPEPVRIVYMKGRAAGLITMEARDKCQGGHGNMLINVLGLFTVVDAKGEHMDDSALVTTLAEFTIAPSYALQPYITWRSIDSMTAGATLEFNNRKVSGIFHFNEAGECTRFDTDSRWQFGEDASPIKWSAICGNYKEKNGIKFPTSFSAVWHEEKGDFEYFKGTISGLEFNVREYVGIRPSRF